MDLLIRFIFDGLVTGCIYALIAVGFGLIFQTTGVFHFAHAAVFGVAAYAALEITTALSGELLTAVVAATVAATILGSAMVVLVYRPLVFRGGSVLVTLIAAIGLTSLVQGLLGVAYGETPRPLPIGGLTNKETILGALRVSPLDVITIVSTTVLLALVLLLVYRSRVGREIRAVGADIALARAFGIDVGRVFLVVFAIGSALLGPAAVLAVTQTYVRPGAGVSLILVASIAVFVGGVGNTIGTIVAAILIGILQYTSLLVVPGSWQNALSYGVLLLVILFVPNGLLAGVSGDRVRSLVAAATRATPSPPDAGDRG